MNFVMVTFVSGKKEAVNLDLVQRVTFKKTGAVFHFSNTVLSEIVDIDPFADAPWSEIYQHLKTGMEQ